MTAIPVFMIPVLASGNLYIRSSWHIHAITRVSEQNVDALVGFRYGRRYAILAISRPTAFWHNHEQCRTSRPIPIDIDLQTCLQTSKLLDDLFRPGERWSGDHGMGGNVFDEAQASDGAGTSQRGRRKICWQ